MTREAYRLLKSRVLTTFVNRLDDFFMLCAHILERRRMGL